MTEKLIQLIIFYMEKVFTFDVDPMTSDGTKGYINLIRDIARLQYDGPIHKGPMILEVNTRYAPESVQMLGWNKIREYICIIESAILKGFEGVLYENESCVIAFVPNATVAFDSGVEVVATSMG